MAMPRKLIALVLTLGASNVAAHRYDKSKIAGGLSEAQSAAAVNALSGYNNLLAEEVQELKLELEVDKEKLAEQEQQRLEEQEKLEEQQRLEAQQKLEEEGNEVMEVEAGADVENLATSFIQQGQTQSTAKQQLQAQEVKALSGYNQLLAEQVQTLKQDLQERNEEMQEAETKAEEAQTSGYAQTLEDSGEKSELQGEASVEEVLTLKQELKALTGYNQLLVSEVQTLTHGGEGDLEELKEEVHSKSKKLKHKVHQMLMLKRDLQKSKEAEQEEAVEVQSLKENLENSHEALKQESDEIQRLRQQLEVSNNQLEAYEQDEMNDKKLDGF